MYEKETGILTSFFFLSTDFGQLIIKKKADIMGIKKVSSEKELMNLISDNNVVNLDSTRTSSETPLNIGQNINEIDVEATNELYNKYESDEFNQPTTQPVNVFTPANNIRIEIAEDPSIGNAKVITKINDIPIYSINGGEGTSEPQRQSDWNEENPTDVTFIKNKPDVITKDMVGSADGVVPLDSGGFIPAEYLKYEGSFDYGKASNKPSINNVELDGEKSLEDLGINIPIYTNELINNSGFIEDLAYVHTDNNFSDEYIEKIEDNITDINEINSKIPHQATLDNQLADKDFVNSSIEQMAAHRVSYNIYGDAFPTKLDLTTATVFYRNGSEYTPNDHDYCLVISDESAPDPYTGGQTRYEWDGLLWAYAYGINSEPFTASEIKALNSGITPELVTKLDGLENYNDTEIKEEISKKANADDVYTKEKVEELAESVTVVDWGE